MLVLSRKKGEALVIGNNAVKIIVVEIRGDKVRLGIDAPPEVPVHRQEVFNAIVRNHGTIVPGGRIDPRLKENQDDHQDEEETRQIA